MKGLIIDEPWVSLILDGSKTWEMRTTHTLVRGRIALIRKGSGRIVGLADVVDSFGPLDDIAWGAHRSKHQIPEHMDSARTRWNHAWILASVVALETPVSYDHPSGAVIWVTLDRDTEQRCLTAAQMPPGNVDSATIISKARMDPRAPAASVPLPPRTAVPVANDETFFGPHLARSSGFTLGAKGEELVVKNFDEALALLRVMPVPRWRRPNTAGNWGIVTGKTWQHLDELTSDAD